MARPRLTEEEKQRREREKTRASREKALAPTLKEIRKKHGNGSIMRIGDATEIQVSAIPTGALALDLATGVGGLPMGRIVEVFGPESSGKTTLVYHILAEAQKRGGLCAFIDAEHAMDPVYAQRIGLNLDDLLVSQPDYGEQALEIAYMLIMSGTLDVVAIDSVAALTPKKQLDGDMGEVNVALMARMLSPSMPKLASALNRSDTLLLLTNQIRERVGHMWGSPETQPGGRALKFYASMRLDIRRVETLKDGTEAVGNKTRVRMVKNKVAAPWKQAEFEIEYGKGISQSGSVIDLGLVHGIITKSGSWFSYGDISLGQGRENAKEYLDEDPELLQKLVEIIYAAAKNEEEEGGGKSRAAAENEPEATADDEPEAADDEPEAAEEEPEAAEEEAPTEKEGAESPEAKSDDDEAATTAIDDLAEAF